MPHNVTFDESVGCYFVTWTETVGVTEIEAYYQELERQPWFGEDVNAFHDFRDAKLDLSEADIRRTVEYYGRAAAIAGPSRRAVLVAGDLTFGVSRMFTTLAEHLPGDFRVCRDVEEAKTWVRLPPDYSLPTAD
jgi:hypothetical protein